jgi:multicomponent Na+:H+ antiporter subunit E
MLAGLAVLWLALSMSLAPPALVAGAASTVAVMLFAVLVGVLDREGAPYLALPRRAGRVLRRIPAVLRESVRASRAVFSPLRPALVRMRTRYASEAARASAIRALSASPGIVVVEADEDAFLLHVNDEDRFDPGEAIVTEAEIVAMVDGAA